MKDLKHLYELERLLEDANNDLVRQAQGEGRKCIATVCENVPEPLLNLPGTFSVRLRAPRTGSMEMATYYMTSFLCEYTRALLERAMEGGYNFTDCLITPDGCTMLNRCIENMELLHTMEKPDFFYEYMEIPMKNDENGLNLYILQCRNHVLTPLKEHFGIDVSDSAIRQAVAEHNRVCQLIRAIGEYRKEEHPRITGYEFHVINLVTTSCPKYLIIDKLRDTLEELKTREPDARPQYRCKVLLAGSENDDPDFTKLIESCGALVVADRYCYGAMESRQPIEIREGETPLRAIARHYLLTSQCTRFMEQNEMRRRKQYIADLAREYKADGIIVASNKFCEYWSYERVIDTIVLQRDFGFPVCSIEKEYINSASGQLRTRFQAFIESVEIKKIQEGVKR